MDDPIERALAALAKSDATRPAPAHLERRVLAAFDRREEPGAFRRWAAVVWDHRREAAAVVIASSITTVAYFKLMEGDLSQPSVPEAAVQAWGSARAEVSAKIGPSSDVPPVPSPVVSRPARRVRTPKVAPAPTWRESDDIVHSVHVRMPRAMLSMLGVPLIEPAAAGTVNVEVLLGPDGIARTIRIVP